MDPESVIYRHFIHVAIAKHIAAKQDHLAASKRSLKEADDPTRMMHHYKDMVERVTSTTCTEDVEQRFDEGWWAMPSQVDVEMVHDVDGIHRMIRAMENASACGLDAEWKPGSERASLLQLAVRSANGVLEDVVFLVDLSTLPKQKVREFVIGILTNKDVLKIGFSLENDLQMLGRALSGEGSGCISIVEPYFDILNVTKVLARRRHLVGEPPTRGLSSLVQFFLGMPLNKSEQCSDWSRRPLSTAQESYAATDAYCLLSIADEICSRCVGPKHSIETALDLRVSLHKTLVLDRNKASRHRGRRRSKKDQPIDIGLTRVPWDIPAALEDVKFLCAEMVEGLARQLRLCGIDAESSRGQSVHALADLAEKEGRVLLTQDKAVASGRITRSAYFVFAQKKQEQLQEVLQRFGLVVPETCLLSRCVHCNGRLHERPMVPSELKDLPSKIPENVVAKYTEFWRCERCSHAYWEGFSYQRALVQFKSRVQAART